MGEMSAQTFGGIPIRGMLHVLDGTGDTKVVWDPKNPGRSHSDSEGSMKVFGDGFWHQELERIPTPVDQLCLYCVEPIVDGDCGVETPYLGPTEQTTVVQHKECFLRGVLGSVGHQRKKCSCFGGTEEDPPGMTRREAAKAALAYTLSPKS